MPRIVVCQAIAELILLVLTAALGMGASTLSTDRHILMAVFALVLSCGIQVVIFTYFTITGKMIAQALHLGGLELAPLALVKSFKKSTARLLGLVVLGNVLATATGATQWTVGERTPWHFVAACGLVLIHGFTFYREVALVSENARLMDGVMSDYTAKRDALRAARESGG
jgi:hypothetical protein